MKNSWFRILRPGLVPVLAALLVLARWLWQGTSNVYTKLALKPYLPDADLGWRRSEDSYLWLGLDLLGICLAVAIVVIVVTYFVRKKRFARVSLAMEGLAGLVVLIPLLAFIGGAPPDNARETQPEEEARTIESGIAGSLPNLPAGRYVIIEQKDAAVAAQMVAGGEKFEARFAGGLEGFLEFNPGDLAQPIRAEIQVDAKSIKTGIDLRDTHALAELKPEKFPTLRFKFGQMTSAQNEGDTLLFEAAGSVFLGDRTHELPFSGSISTISPALAEKLGVTLDAPHLLVKASLTLTLADTIIENDGTFDKDEVPVLITLILKHTKK